MNDEEWTQGLAETIEANWRSDFIRLVTTGEASTAFLKHVDSCQKCSDAITEAYNRGVEKLQALGKMIAEGKHQG